MNSERVVTDNELIDEVINANDILVVAMFDGWTFDPERWIPPNIWLEKWIDGTNRTIQVRRADRTFVSTFPSLKYDTSWSHLMPVIKKITPIAKRIGQQAWFDIGSSLIDADIEGAFRRVVSFIKWYNSNVPIKEKQP